MKIKKITMLSFLSLLLITGCGEKETTDESSSTQTKKEVAPQFNFTTVLGKPITITAEQEGWKFAGIENKVVLVNFFGTWCPPCIAEIPHLNNIRSKVNEDFEILSVDIGPRSGGVNSQEHLEEFIQKHSITYPIVSGTNAKKLFAAVSDLNKSSSVPFMILFNKQGQYVKYYIGMKPEEMLFNDINATIKMQ
ncbi:MAG: TlpA disulfide reductase family protein [Arcobacteraceae bacterium]